MYNNQNDQNFTVVHQFYQSEVNNEYVIRGNAAILKCSIPSFVAEFVQIVGWQDDQGNTFNTGSESGSLNLYIYLLFLGEIYICIPKTPQLYYQLCRFYFYIL